MTNLHQAFRSLKNPRIHRNRKNKLMDVIALSILAILSDAESYDSIALFGRKNLEFLRQFLELKNGIPSHDTVNWVFQILNPRQFERCFILWAQGLKDNGIMERVIAIDGKTVRGSKDSSPSVTVAFRTCMERWKWYLSETTGMWGKNQRNNHYSKNTWFAWH